MNTENLTYEHWVSLAEAHFGKLKIVEQSLGITRSAVFKNAQRNNGIVEPKYVYMLLGLIAQHDKLYLSCLKHKHNEALLALLNELDRKP